MKPIIVIKLRPRNYAGHVNLGNRVFASLTGNINYTTPLPALTVLTSNIDDVVAAISLWGPKGNRGSHADLLDLQAKTITLGQTLKSLAQYCMNTVQTSSGNDYPGMASLLGTSGFDVLTDRNPQGLLEPVQNFHVFVSPQYNPNQVKLLWRKPLNVSLVSNVKSYRILRGTTAVFADAVQIATTTKAKFTDANTTGTVQTWFYWVIPVNSAGSGAVSEVVSVSLFSM